MTWREADALLHCRLLRVRDLFQNRPEKQSTSSSFTLRGHSAFLHLSARHCVGRGDFGSDLRRVIKR